LGTRSISTNPFFAYLKDSENYLYQPESVLSPKELPLIDLAPGDTLRGEIYWEIPEEAIISEFIWQDFQSDIHIIIPEFPTLLVLPLIVIITSMMLVIWRRNKILPR
jgi:hypothetical protein